MDRLFGKSKPAAARPTLQDAHSSMEKRGESIDQKIMKLDKELGSRPPSRSARALSTAHCPSRLECAQLDAVAVAGVTRSNSRK